MPRQVSTLIRFGFNNKTVELLSRFEIIIFKVVYVSQLISVTRPVFPALAIDHLVGNFEVGKEFDALLVSLDCPGSQVDIFDDDTPEDLVQKFIFLGKDYRYKCKRTV